MNEFFEIGYDSRYTGESWPALRDAVASVVQIGEDDAAQLRSGWDAAQADLEAWNQQGAVFPPAEEPERASGRIVTDTEELSRIPY